MVVIPVIFLEGPTASGKTDLALQISEELPCEIISVDSVMIYRGMDIGSAKPSKAVLQKCPHHLIDILDPSESYSAANFRADALRLIREIHARKNNTKKQRELMKKNPKIHQESTKNEV